VFLLITKRKTKIHILEHCYTNRVVDGDGVVSQQFLLVAAAVFQKVVDVDFPVLTPTAVDVGR